MVGDIRRVTAGTGGEALLIMGRERTCLYDAGMAYCGRKMVENLIRELNGRPLDFVILSHTHYDHIGGLPYVREQYPKVTVMGSVLGQPILEKPKALAVIRNLSQTASDSYSDHPGVPLDYKDEGFRMDVGLTEGSVISLGDRHIRAFVTMGHTRCSMTYYLEEDSILLASESTGICLGRGQVHSSILTGFQDSMDSIEKCRAIGAKHIISPHFLEVDEETAARFWDLSREAGEEIRDFILGCLRKGMSEEALLEACTDHYWVGSVKDEQPREAFQINLKAKVKVILREFGPQGE